MLPLNGLQTGVEVKTGSPDMQDSVGRCSRNNGGFRLEIGGQEAYHLPDSLLHVAMLLPVISVLLQGLGPLGSPPAILVGLAVLALVVLVGRFVLALAWRLVLIALAVGVVLWILGILGFGVL